MAASRHHADPPGERVFPCAAAGLTLAGRAGILEATTTCPDAPARAATAVICHPHPQHGGSMHNKVVHTLARAFGDLGLRTLRFNFRGVGGSAGSYDHGIGETDDLVAVLNWVRVRRPSDEIWLAGFSFGAYVALRATARWPVARLVLVAPPVNLYDFDALPPPRCPLLVVQGDDDEIVPAADVAAWSGRLAPAPELVVLDGVGHFFHGRLPALRAAVGELAPD